MVAEPTAPTTRRFRGLRLLAVGTVVALGVALPLQGASASEARHWPGTHNAAAVGAGSGSTGSRGFRRLPTSCRTTRVRTVNGCEAAGSTVPTTTPPTTSPTTTPTTTAPTTPPTVPATTVPPTTAPPATVPAVAPVFSDSFDQGLRLSSNRSRSVWMPVDYGWQSQPALATNERGYEDFAGNSWNVNPNRDPGQSPFSVVNGNLRIQASRIPSTYLTSTGGVRDQMAAQGQDVNNLPSWMGGILISERSFLYGYIQTTVTIDAAHAGRGMFPALWLYAAGGSGDPQGKGGAEIDLMEAFGTTSQFSSTLHFIDSSNREARPSRSTDFSRSVVGTHTYALDWQPTYLRFYFDGQLVWEVTGADATWFNTPMRLRMNYSMDAPWFASGRHSDATTPATLWMDVADISVWTTKP